MRNMMFARTFPAYHPKKGLPTNFIQKIWANPHIEPMNADLLGLEHIGRKNAFLAKGHTIRAGNRWKVGDYFKPLVWSGIPYRSKTIQIASPIMVERVWEIEIARYGSGWQTALNGSRLIYAQEENIISGDGIMNSLAKNDGLSIIDFLDWFRGKPSEDQYFMGQIICWNKSIDYFGTTGKPSNT